MAKKKTHDEYVAEVAEINPDIEVLGKYIKSSVKTKHKCIVCLYGSDGEWTPIPNHILRGHGCPKCSNKNNGLRQSKQQKQYEKELKEINPNIKIIGEYSMANVKTPHRCDVCGHGSHGEWSPTPSNLLKGHGCPVCCHKIIGSAPEYKNSIWASEYKDYFSKYITEEQMKTYMPNSAQKVNITCPDCGKIKNIQITTLKNFGLGCSCSDGQSYPNKFIYSMLNQLNIKYEAEYSPIWANGKRYDIYIPTLDCIIENHGKQHYVEQTGVFHKLEETRENDSYKHQLALNNNVKNYIILDCRYSNSDWIKKSIYDSQLFDVLCRNYTDVDWNICNEYALKNIVKTVSELWNEGLSIKEIYKKTSISHSATIDYLRKGKDAGWCDYNGQDAHRRNHNIYVERLKKWHSRAVYCFELNECFDSMAEAGRRIGSTSTNVKQCCDGVYHAIKGYHFCYANEINTYVFKQNKTNKKLIFCDKENKVYAGIKDVAKLFGVHECTIMEYCNSSNHFCKKTNCSWYYLYDQTRKDGTIIPGAITLGLITEEEALNMFEEKEND